MISYLRFPSIIASLIHRGDKSFKLIVSERNTTQRLDRLERFKFWTYQWADVIVPNSQSQYRFIERNYPKYIEKTFTITNFADTNSFVPSEAVEQHDKPVLISVGRVMEQKNVLRYLDVLKHLKDEGLLFDARWYGETPGAYYYQCEEKLEALGLSDVFKFMGKSTNVLDVYQSADIFCLPSIYEGFPNVLCEAMSCGLPVVASNVCDNPDIADNTCGLLFDPTDEEDMYIKLKEMLTLPKNKLSLMGQSSRRRAVELFSEEKFITKYEALF